MKNINSSILQGIWTFFCKGEDVEVETNEIKKDVAEIVTNEMDSLWKIVRDDEGAMERSERDCCEIIAQSFTKMKELFGSEELDNAYAWPRYVKLAVHTTSEPIKELVEHVDEHNYIYLTKRMTDLSRSLDRKDDTEVLNNMEAFSEAVYNHILKSVDANDTPACLWLGRLAQRKGDLVEAKEWFTRITETDDPINGITSLLACNENEIKEIINRNKRRKKMSQKDKEILDGLSRKQCDMYEHWCEDIKGRIDNDSTSERYKIAYVTLMTGFARFERNRGNYDKAYDILMSIPESYPEMHRVYAEQAMLYQFRPYQNHHYCLEKAIETFRKADDTIKMNDSGKKVSVKSRKSILMPMANAYFQSGRYGEASRVCESVLSIDDREVRAIRLKEQIERLAS